MTMTDKKARRAATFPVTTLGELPIVSEDERAEDERAEMIASLKAAEARVAAGEFVDHVPETFVDRLMVVRDAAIRSKNA